MEHKFSTIMGPPKYFALWKGSKAGRELARKFSPLVTKRTIKFSVHLEAFPFTRRVQFRVMMISPNKLSFVV